jgi:asparagine synthase (glutamine-hydrolysing)
MKNFFLLRMQPYSGLTTDEAIYSLNNSLEIKVEYEIPSKIFDTDNYFYFRFGTLSGQNNEDEDSQIALRLLGGETCISKGNNGYFGVFFFNKDTGKGSIYTDRIGVHKTYFQSAENSLTISNDTGAFNFNETESVDSDWLAEIVNFKICTGSYTYNPKIKQLPAAHLFNFDSKLQPVSAGFYWEIADRIPHTDISLEDATEHSLKLLNKHLSGADIKNKRVAVLLSGGVDSSLLAALTKEHNNNVIAITPVFKTGDNPELAAAKEMAKNIDIEHQIIEISDEDIEEEFSKTVNFIKQPLRSPQTLIFSILMRQFNGKFDAVIFGEGADMIFGYHAVEHAAKRYEKHCKVASLKPLLPLINIFDSISVVKKLSGLISDSAASQVLNSWAIEYSPRLKEKLPNVQSNSSNIEIIEWLNLQNINYKNLDKTGFENLVRKFIIHESCMYHFYTMGAIASREGLELVSPFFDADVVEYAANFDNRLYFGNGVTKPILRKISEKFYSKELIYAKKQAFPTPHEKWLNGPLKSQASTARDFIIENYGKSASKNNEFVWLIMAFKELDITDTLKK